MKFFIPFVAALLSFSQASALAIEQRQPSEVEARTAATCGNPSDAIAFLRAFNPTVSDHFYTTSAPELENAIANLGYSSQGIAAYVFGSQEASTVPLYRLNNPQVDDHFYTISVSERDNAINSMGYVLEGTAAFVYQSPICSSIPFFRLVNPTTGDHFYTTSASERDNAAATSGYVYEGIAAYVLPV